MSELHRKPLVELISPIASQNEIQIGNRTKIHALLVFLVKLDKIKKNLPNSWELVPREERLHTGILPMGFIIFSIIIFKPPRFLVSERKFPWGIAFAKSFFLQKIYFPRPGREGAMKTSCYWIPTAPFFAANKSCNTHNCEIKQRKSQPKWTFLLSPSISITNKPEHIFSRNKNLKRKTYRWRMYRIAL